MPIDTPKSPSPRAPAVRHRPRVAILGATGLVGRAMTRLLEERVFPVGTLLALASSSARTRSVGFAGELVEVQPVSRELLESADLVLASAGGDVSREWLPIAAAGGAVCIDNTSAFRMDPTVALVVPEVNADRLATVDLGGGGAIIANPNCSTIQLVVALEPLRRAFGLNRVQVSTYQSISGAGARAVDRFRSSTAALLDNGDRAEIDRSTPAFDVIPQIGDVEADGHTSEEWKMILETPKILGEEIALDVTCVRVPVFNGHAEAVIVETKEPVTLAEAREVLRGAPGVVFHDDATAPTPAAIAGSRDVHIGRLRSSRTFARGLQFWIVADNLLKGAAWNAVQIAEALVNKAVINKAVINRAVTTKRVMNNTNDAPARSGGSHERVASHSSPTPTGTT